MYNQPIYIPNYMPPINTPFAMRNLRTLRNINTINPLINGINPTSKNIGLIRRLGNSLSIFKNINWGGFITNTSKTLNVVNQAIPLVRQVGPMVNNVKSMIKVASVFKDETDKVPKSKPQTKYQPNLYNNLNNNNTYQESKLIPKENTIQKRQENIIQNEDYSPTFFIPT